MRYRRMPIEVESPEEFGYDRIRCNLAESSFADARFSELGVKLDELVLMYHDHRGHRGLRELVAEDLGVRPDQVLTTVGAAAALFMIATSQLERGDHLVVMRPNYATNLETPRAIGCDISFLDVRFEDGWQLDVARLEALLRPSTKLVSLTCPHNPTGAVLSESTLRAAAALCEARGIYLLVDETYREMTYGGPRPAAVTMSERVISVSSLSKTYGLPGIRMGWLATRDPGLYETLLAAKEQIFICGSIVDEEIACQALSRRAQWLPAIQARIDAAFRTTRDWMASQQDLEWVEPAGGVVCFPRMRSEQPGTAPRHLDVERFYRVLLEEYGTVVGPGHWFEQPKHSFRLGYGWPTPEALAQGLDSITKALRAARV